MQGLSPSRIVNVDVSFSPLAVPLLNFDTLLVLTDNPELLPFGIFEANSLADVAYSLGTASPEYQAAALYFGQIPAPKTLFIARWNRTSSEGALICGPLSGQEQLISNWNTITNGQFRITIDGVGFNDVSNLNFTSATNLNAVAGIIDAGLSGGTVGWDGFEFFFTSNSFGPSSSVSFAINVPAGVGTQIAAQLKATSTTAAGLIQGRAAETPVAAVARYDGLGWYAVTFACDTIPSDADTLAVAAYIQSGLHLYGTTSGAASILNPSITFDIASQLALADYTRTVLQYSITHPYAVTSFFGRAFTTNFEGSNTTITMMFKQQPGVIPEILTATQASTLSQKRANVYATYNNGASIVQEGVVSGLAYFDEIHGTDWLANRIQTDMFNVLYQSPKIPQTNPGVHVLLTAMEGGLSQAVTNGLSAPGTWNAPGFGELKQGDYLPKGFYSYVASVDTQPQSERETRRAPLFQAAVKLAGAVHFADVLVNINRAIPWLIGAYTLTSMVA